MSTAPKAAAIILGGAIALYVILFLLAVPAMTSRVLMVQKMGVNIYAALYRPVRDLLPPGNAARELWQDYEAYWCSGADTCQL